MASAVADNKTLLVTGITGYVAAVLGEIILRNGYRLRGTTRSKKSADALLAGPYAECGNRVEILEVADITIDGAFDEAIKGVHGAFHVASPMGLDKPGWDEMVMPAVKSTTTLLESARPKAGPQLESIIFTSSITTMMKGFMPDQIENKVYTEADSGFEMIDVTKNMTPESPMYPVRAFAAYMAAKKLSENAVWEFWGERSPNFAITTIHPVSIIGRPAFMPSDPTKLSPSFLPILQIWKGPAEADMPAQLAQGAFVDVWDVAQAHLWAFQNHERADGDNYILSTGFGPPQARADIMREHFPESAGGFIKGTPGKGYAEGTDHEGRKTKYW